MASTLFEETRRAAVRYGIPAHCITPLCEYLANGERPESFLTAGMANDLVAAVCFADDINRVSLDRYARFLANVAPETSWGSHDWVAQWVAAGGLEGKVAEASQRRVA